MKKLLLTIVIVLAVSLTAASLTLADEAPASSNATIQRAFLDADGDGVCDRSGVMRARKGYTADTTGAYSPGPNFVDEDGDGVCDNCDGTPNLYRYNYGVQNQEGAMNGPSSPGPNFVDEDGDGVCDNCDGTPNLYRYNYGNQNQEGAMNGPHSPGPNFVDADGDGVCDNCAMHQHDYDYEYQSPGPHGRMNENRQGTGGGNP